MTDTASTVRIFYLRDGKGFPIATVATDLLMKSDLGGHETSTPLGVIYGIAVWNPKDKFDKALSRQIALGRMNLNGTIIYVRENFKRAVMEHIAERFVLDEAWGLVRIMPNKVRQAAQRWLDEKEQY